MIAGNYAAQVEFYGPNRSSVLEGNWIGLNVVNVGGNPTTYTFIMRHEAASANTAPGVTPSETIMAKYPYTLAIVGHTHDYEKSGAKEVIFGNEGAPLTTSSGTSPRTQREPVPATS